MKAFLVIFAICVATVIANPIENIQFPSPNFFQGDLKLTALQQQPSTNRNGRLGWQSTYWQWPKDANGLVSIPFTIQASSGYTQAQVNIIIERLDEIQRMTCVRFIPRTTQADYVEFVSSDGCWSYMGRIRGRQELSLARNGCVSKGTVIHETVHAIGFNHMQNAFDRDNYIKVMWENMNPRDYESFDKVNQNDWSHFGTTYDYVSIMHYEANTFSINGRDVMVPHDPAFIGRLGGGSNLSTGDAFRIRNMYRC